MSKTSTITALCVGLGVVTSVRSEESLPQQVRGVLERRVAEVARTRELESLQTKSDADLGKLTHAVREGSAYERFVAARVLARSERGRQLLENLAVELARSETRFASLFRALTIAGRAAGQGEAAVDAVFTETLGRTHDAQLRTYLTTLYLERRSETPSPEALHAAGISATWESSAIVLRKTLDRASAKEGDPVRHLIDVLESSALPRHPRDPLFPSRAQAAVGLLIAAGEPALVAVLERYRTVQKPAAERDYLVLLYVVDVLQGLGDARAIPLLERVREFELVDPDRRKFIAMHRAGEYHLARAAAVAEYWIESGERYPYGDWLSGWYRWFVVDD